MHDVAIRCQILPGAGFSRRDRLGGSMYLSLMLMTFFYISISSRIIHSESILVPIYYYESFL